MSKVYSLIFAGVGGQGSLLIADATSLAAVQAGYDAKQTEVHGVSQRGGSVETHVRFGEKVYSPLVTAGQADVVVGLEKLEALRFGHFANPEYGVILANDFEIVPASVQGAEQLYPHETVDYLKNKSLRVITMPASAIAALWLRRTGQCQKHRPPERTIHSNSTSPCRNSSGKPHRALPLTSTSPMRWSGASPPGVARFSGSSVFR